MKKHVMMLLILINSAINPSQIIDALALASKLKVAAQPAKERLLARRNQSEFSRPFSTHPAANIVPGQKDMLERIERGVEATVRGAENLADETKEKIAMLRRRTAKGISSVAKTSRERVSTAWATVAMTPEAIAEFFKRTTQDSEEVEPSTHEEATTSQSLRRNTLAEMAAAKSRQPIRSALAKLKPAKNQLEVMHLILEKALAEADKVSHQIVEEASKTANEIMQLIPELERQVKEKSSNAIKDLKKSIMISKKMSENPTAKPSAKSSFIRPAGYNRNLATTPFLHPHVLQYQQAQHALATELSEINDEPFAEDETDPTIASNNQKIALIKEQATTEIEAIHDRAKLQAELLQEKALITAHKIAKESLESEATKFIAAMNTFYKILIENIKSELRSGKTFLKIKADFNIPEINEKTKTMLTTAAQYWLQFESTFKCLPVAIDINSKTYKRTPIQWAKLTAQAGFTGSEANELFDQLYTEHAHAKFEQIQKLAKELEQKAGEYLDQKESFEDDIEAFEKMKPITVEAFKQILEEIYKLLFAQTIKSFEERSDEYDEVTYKTIYYFAIKSEFTEINREERQSVLRELALVWQALINNDLIQQDELVTLYHPLAADKQKLQLTATQWRDYTANAKLDSRDSDDTEFARIVSQETTPQAPKSQPFTETLTNMFSRRVNPEDDL